MADEKEQPSTVKRVTELTILLAFYLYFAGWVYAEALFRSFGLSMHAVDVPVYFLIVYSYEVFFSNFFGWLLLLGLGAAWYAVAIRPERRFATAIVVLLTFAPFPLIRLLADARATHDGAVVRNGHAPRVVAHLRATVRQEYPADLLKSIETGPLRLVTQTSERYYVFHQPQDPASPDLPRGKLYDLPLSDFVFEITLENVRKP